MSAGKIPVVPYTPKELRVLYNISKYQFDKWMELISEEIGLPVAGKYTPDQVQKMFNHWGEPDQEKN